MGNKRNKQTVLHFLIAIGFVGILLFVEAGRKGAAAERQPPTIDPSNDWNVECVDCLRYFTNMSGDSAALDSSGLIHTTYGGDSLYFATQTPSGNYQTEVVDNNPRRGLNATMVLDGSDRPHILYYAKDLLRLNYAYKDGGQWQISTLPTVVLTALPYPWLAIDSSDNLHVAFNIGNQLTYGFYDQNNWQFTTVDVVVSGNIGRPSLALDSSGRPHIAYGQGQKYAYFDGLEWKITTFLGSYSEGRNNAIALDQSDNPHIVYQTEFNGTTGLDLRYRYFDGNEWQVEDIDASVSGLVLNTGYDISLILNAADKPIVVYTIQYSSGSPYPWFEYYLPRIATREPTGWEFEDLITGSFQIYDTNYNTLLSSTGGNLTFVYKDGYYLKSTVLTGARLTTAIIDQGGSTGTHIDMVVDSEDRLSVSAHEFEGDRLRYGLKSQGNWAAKTPYVGAGFSGSDWTSLALTTDNRPFIMFDKYIRVGGLPYVFFNGSGWIYAEHMEDSSSFEVGMDRNDNFHIAFISPNGGSLKYFKRDPLGNLSDVTIIDPNTVAGQLDIALDTADFPHIAYPANDGLGYAVQTPSGWFNTTVTGGSVDFPSLALDENGRPHIAWYDKDDDDLRYAAFSGSSWLVTTLDSGGDVGQYPSLAVDRLGRAYIAYYDATNQDLKYAAFDGSSWTTTTLLSDGNVGAFSKLVMPFAGYPAIAYYDATSRDLKLIYRPFLPTNFTYLPTFLAANP